MALFTSFENHTQKGPKTMGREQVNSNTSTASRTMGSKPHIAARWREQAGRDETYCDASPRVNIDNRSDDQRRVLYRCQSRNKNGQFELLDEGETIDRMI